MYVLLVASVAFTEWFLGRPQSLGGISIQWLSLYMTLDTAMEGLARARVAHVGYITKARWGKDGWDDANFYDNVSSLMPSYSFLSPCNIS